MTEPDQAIIARLSYDIAAAGAYLARAAADLHQLERTMVERAAQPYAQPQPQTQPYPWPPVAHQQPDTQPPTTHSDGWIGKALAVAGVTVTLVGVALLLVLAAKAGILRPEFRVFAGAVLAAGLVIAGWRLNKRPAGRVGAIALAATGIAAAYIDVIAVTTIYHWVSAPVGLGIAAVVAASGLALSRRWDTEHLGILVLVPLIGLAPVVADGVSPLLIGFMLALSAASVPVQLGKDWIGLHAARMAASTLSLLVALATSSFDAEQSALLAAACAVAGALAIGSAVILLPHNNNSVALALLSAVGTMPVLTASLAINDVVAALMAAALSTVLLGIVFAGSRLAMVTSAVRIIWSALAAVSSLIAVTVAFDGPVAGPVLLAMAVVVAIAGRGVQVAYWCALGLAVVGGLYYLVNAPLTTLVRATTLSTPIGMSTLISSVLLVAFAMAIAWSLPADWSRTTAAVAAWYGITVFAVTAGVLLGGEVQGFFVGQMAATICWITLAAAMFRHAANVPRAQRSLPIAGGMALVAAAMAKLFLFDLGTLDGMFRVAVFIVVGLALLGMGAGYARLLGKQDDGEQRS